MVERQPLTEHVRTEIMATLTRQIAQLQSDLAELGPIYEAWQKANAAVDALATSDQPFGNSATYEGKRSWLIASSPEGRKLVEISRQFVEKKKEQGHEHLSYETIMKLRKDSQSELDEYIGLVEKFTDVAQQIKTGESISAEVAAVAIARLGDVIHADWQATSGYPERWKPVDNDADFVKRQLLSRGDAHTQATFRILDGNGKPISIDQLNPDTPLPTEYTAEEDIQHRNNSELSPRNARLNRLAAEAIFEIVKKAIASGDTLDEQWLEKAAATVHVGWIARNQWVLEPGKDAQDEATRVTQRRNYDDPNFTEEQRNKDRRLVVVTLQKYAEALQTQDQLQQQPAI